MARSMGDLLHPNDPRDAARALRSSSGGGVAAGEGGGAPEGQGLFIFHKLRGSFLYALLPVPTEVYEIN